METIFLAAAAAVAALSPAPPAANARPAGVPPAGAVRQFDPAEEASRSLRERCRSTALRAIGHAPSARALATIERIADATDARA